MGREKSVNEKIAFLRWLSNHGPKKYFYYKTRRNMWIPKAYGVCDVCGVQKAYCKHHIIPIIKGGNNSDENLINICRHCHEEIHPFMKRNSIEKEEAYLRKAFFETVSYGGII